MVDTRVVYLEPSQIRIETITLPELKPNQVLVKTHQASVCGSERYFYRGINVRPRDEARGGAETQLGEKKEGRPGKGGPKSGRKPGSCGAQAGRRFFSLQNRRLGNQSAICGKITTRARPRICNATKGSAAL